MDDPATPQIAPSKETANQLKDRYKPPFLPRDNPTGCYVRESDLPQHLAGLDTFVWYSGVESAFYLWVNGKPVGNSTDSKLPSEFRLAEYMVSGRNTMALMVLRFCALFYLEDQDYWHLSGIYRSVRLVSKPPLHLRDTNAQALTIRHTSSG